MVFKMAELVTQTIEIAKVVELTYEQALEKTIEALKVEGFGILTEIDVKATFKKKLEVDFEKYKILGACNPPFAKKALDVDRSVGTLLPCNVYVQEVEPNKTKVSAIDPMKMFQILPNKELEPIAKEIQERLTRAVNSI